MANNPDDLLSPDDLSGLLKVPKSTVYGWRSRGDGPVASKVGRHLRYRRREVDRWLDEHSDTARTAS
jgi:excisionase family DNA binding protein